MKILIVDDDFVNRKLMSALLKDYGQCEVASDGEEAIERYEKGVEDNDPVNVVFMDILMPGIDGHKALEKIREIEKREGIMYGDGAKIVMTSCLSDRQNVLSAFSEGAEYYLIKPVTPQKLYDLLKKMEIDKQAV